MVKARTRITNHRADKTQYPGRTQEMPAVYVNGPYCHLFTYTGAPLTQFTNRLDLEKHWTNWLATEHWAAQVNAAGWSLGVWTPETTRISGGFYKEPGAGGPEDAPTGYLAPNRHEILDHNIVFDYRYELILGTLDEIRSHCVRNADTNLLPYWEICICAARVVFRRSERCWLLITLSVAANHSDIRLAVRAKTGARPALAHSSFW